MANNKNRQRQAIQKRAKKRADRSKKFRDLKSSRHDERVALKMVEAAEMKKKIEKLVKEKFTKA